MLVYRTCIFCSADLGTNEASEPFPVGRRSRSMRGGETEEIAGLLEVREFGRLRERGEGS